MGTLVLSFGDLGVSKSDDVCALGAAARMKVANGVPIYLKMKPEEFQLWIKYFDIAIGGIAAQTMDVKTIVEVSSLVAYQAVEQVKKTHNEVDKEQEKAI